MRQFEEQVVLVTGGANGIGRATAEAFAREGAPMLERAGLLKDEGTRKAIESLHAMRRMGQPEEVAEAVLFLASSKASFVAGHPLLVDGGYVAQ
jgi:NAD(P)-dependent dehydrogenase (short-subunit alcohol dehydrogenase family)